MQILRDPEFLSKYFHSLEVQPKCLVDTGFLYALAYADDRLFEQVNDLLDLLSDYGVTFYINVISRMEFVDLLFRKQVTQGCIELFNNIKHNAQYKDIFNLLKDIRDKDTAARRKSQSYKLDEYRLKRLRENIKYVHEIGGWEDFCQKYVGSMLQNEWMMIEEDLGLNFIEVMEGSVSDEITSPLRWKDMVNLMGEHGLRGPDAMILNLFMQSKFEILITTDSDFKLCLDNQFFTSRNKAVYLLT